MANVAINVEVRSNGEVVLGKVGDQLEAVGKKAKESKSQMEGFLETLRSGTGFGAGFAIGEQAASAFLDALKETTRFLAETITKTVEFAESIDKLGVSTGLSARSLQVLSAIARESNTDFGALVKSVGKLEIAIGSNAKEFDKLGLSAGDLRKMLPEQALGEVTQRLLAMPDIFERNEVAAKLFGRNFIEILPALKDFNGETDRFNTLSEDQLASMKELDSSLDQTQTAWEDFKRQLAAAAVDGGGIANVFSEIAQGVRDFGMYLKENHDEIAWYFSTLKTAADLGTLGATYTGSEESKLAGVMRNGYGDLPGVKMPSMFGPGGGISIGGPTRAEEEAERQALQHREDAEKASLKRHEDMLKELAKYNKLMSDIVKDRISEADIMHDMEETVRQIEQTTKGIDFVGLSDRRAGRLRGGDMLASVGGAGLFTRYQDVLDQEMENAARQAKETADAQKRIADEAARWTGILQGVNLLAGAIGGKFGAMLQASSGIAQSLKGWDKMSGTDKFNAVASGVGQIGGVIGGTAGSAISGAAGGAMAGMAVGGPVGAVIGGALGLIGGIFGGNKRKKEEEAKEAEQFKQMTDQLKAQFGTLAAAASMADKYGVNLQRALDSKKPKELDAALKELEKRMKGLETATEGVKTLIDNLTYTDAAGNLMDTFSDPAVVGSAANLFSVQFWQVFQKQGIAGLDKMRPAWSKLLGDLTRMGLDPVAMGLGRVGRMMDLTNDPKTRALLGASQGVGQMLRGSMDAGYLDKGMLADASNVAKATLKELQDNGMTAAEAAQAQEDQLAALADAYKQTGQEMPDWLKDAMSAAGMELLPTQLDVLKESRDYLKEIAGARGYAGGGIVTERQLAWVGENGPEEIMPMDGSGYQGGRRGGLNVNIYRAPGMTRETEAAFDRRVARIMDRTLRNDARVRASARVAVNGGR